MIKPGFLILLLAALLSGCITQKRCAERYPSAERSNIYVQHDTITNVKDSLIPMPADSGLIKALLECQDGKVVVKEILEVKPGKRVVPFFSVQNNVLTTGAKIDSSSIYFAWKETHIRESRIESRTIEKTVFKVSGFQNFLIWSGRIAWAVIVMLFAIKLIRFYIKRKLPL
ncbi:MAG: hypothetical protein Q8M08_05230 [Bacteroidales bacterium]|nr:hypothetical protein [Bacteroidales bacterium]